MGHRTILPAVPILLLVGLAGAGVSLSWEPATSPAAAWEGGFYGNQEPAGSRSTVSAGELSTLVDSQDRPVRWSRWLDDHGPVLVVVWASWAPHSAAVLDRLDGIVAAGSERGLTVVLVDVQETLDDAREAMGQRDLTWFHDRHGATLKRYRVTKVPSLVVVAADGGVVARLEPTAEAVRGLESEQEAGR